MEKHTETFANQTSYVLTLLAFCLNHLRYRHIVVGKVMPQQSIVRVLHCYHQS